VIVQGLTDACDKFLWLSRSNAKYLSEAKEWIGSKDFNLVCSFAGLQPHEVKEIYYKLKQHTHYLTVEDIRYLLNEIFSRRSVL
jgi:hypothetical protein